MDHEGIDLLVFQVGYEGVPEAWRFCPGRAIKMFVDRIDAQGLLWLALDNLLYRFVTILWHQGPNASNRRA